MVVDFAESLEQFDRFGTGLNPLPKAVGSIDGGFVLVDCPDRMTSATPDRGRRFDTVGPLWRRSRRPLESEQEQRIGQKPLQRQPDAGLEAPFAPSDTRPDAMGKTRRCATVALVRNCRAGVGIADCSRSGENLANLRFIIFTFDAGEPVSRHTNRPLLTVIEPFDTPRRYPPSRRCPGPAAGARRGVGRRSRRSAGRGRRVARWEG